MYPPLPYHLMKIEWSAKRKMNSELENKINGKNVDWENECLAIKRKGSMIERITWEETDIKVKSLIYLSPGAEATKKFHQRNPLTRIDRIATNELLHELNITFTRPRKITFERFQFFNTT